MIDSKTVFFTLIVGYMNQIYQIEVRNLPSPGMSNFYSLLLLASNDPYTVLTMMGTTIDISAITSGNTITYTKASNVFSLFD